MKTWKQSGKPLARACGLVFLGFVGPCELVALVREEKKRLEKLRKTLDLSDESNYEVWADIVERQLPKIKDVLGKLHYAHAASNLDTGVRYDLCALADACQVTPQTQLGPLIICSAWQIVASSPIGVNVSMM